MSTDTNDGRLFWLVTSCGLLGAFVPVIVKMVTKTFVKVSQFISRETDMEASLRRQVCDLKAELGSISMVDEFAKYAKIQRKINKITQELTHQSELRASYTLRVHLVATAMLYGVIAISVLSLLWNYRLVPVVTLPDHWTYPLGPLLAYPLESGAISLTTWLLVTTAVGKLVASSVL